MTPWRGRLLASCAFFLAAIAQASAPPVVMVADLAGRILSVGGHPLTLAEGIPAHTALRLGPGTRLVVIHLGSGEELTFSGPATLRFDGTGQAQGAVPVGRRKVPALQEGLRLEPGAWAQASVVIRKGIPPGGFSLEPDEPLPFRPQEPDGRSSAWLHPLGMVVLDPAPAFRWRLPIPGVTAHLFLGEEGAIPVIDADVPGETWSLPAGGTLRRGATYQWRLSWPLKADFTAETQGTFRMATEEESHRVQALRPPAEAPFTDRLAYAAALEALGLRDEALPCWQTLSRERPEDPTLARMAKP